MITETHRGFEITAVEVKRGFKYIIRQEGEIVWSSWPIRNVSLDLMISAGKIWVDNKYPPTLGVQSGDTARALDRFGG